MFFYRRIISLHHKLFQANVIWCNASDRQSCSHSFLIEKFASALLEWRICCSADTGPQCSAIVSEIAGLNSPKYTARNKLCNRKLTFSFRCKKATVELGTKHWDCRLLCVSICWHRYQNVLICLQWYILTDFSCFCHSFISPRTSTALGIAISTVTSDTQTVQNVGHLSQLTESLPVIFQHFHVNDWGKQNENPVFLSRLSGRAMLTFTSRYTTKLRDFLPLVYERPCMEY